MQLYNLNTLRQATQGQQLPKDLWLYASVICVACCFIALIFGRRRQQSQSRSRSLQAVQSLLPTTSKDLGSNLTGDTVTKNNNTCLWYHLGRQLVGGETMDPEKKSPSMVTSGVAKPEDDNTNQVQPKDESNPKETSALSHAETQPEDEEPETYTQAKKSPPPEPCEPIPSEEEEPLWRRHSYPRDQAHPGPLRKNSTHHEMEHVPDEFHSGIIWRRRTIVFEGKA